MKTIFVTSFFGLIARNILATSVLGILREHKDLRIVIFAPKEKEVLYRGMFAGENVIVEGVPQRRSDRLDRFITSVFLNSSDTSARRIHRLVERRQNKKIVRAAYHWFLAKLSYWRFYRWLLRRCDYKFSSRTRFEKYFKKYSPDLVFVTDIFESDDIDMAREARSKGSYVLGMVRSWDNITTKGLNRIKPDKLIVNTALVKFEAVRYCDFKDEDIVIVGVPHYDNYIPEKRISRELLFERLGLDPSKKTIFFAAPSDIYARGDPITQKVIESLMLLDAQIILRLYIVGQADLGHIKPIPGKLVIDDPGGKTDFVQADLTGQDAHLADLLYHSDVVIAFASTLAIDAVVFDKPVVLVGFDGLEGRSYWQSLRRFYDYDHQRSIIESGGVRLAETPAEFLYCVKHYLENPSLDADGRKRILSERCWRLDGQSSRRLAAIILRLLL